MLYEFLFFVYAIILGISKIDKKFAYRIALSLILCMHFKI